MNYATFAALTEYATPALALAAKPTNGQAWLMNETQIARDGTMPDSGPAGTKDARDQVYAGNTSVPLQRNSISAAYTGSLGPTGTLRNISNKPAGYANTTKGGGTFVNRQTITNARTPMIRHKVAWYVTDSDAPGGYRRVFGILEDPTTTNAYRDDDAQVRK